MIPGSAAMSDQRIVVKFFAFSCGDFDEGVVARLLDRSERRNERFDSIRAGARMRGRRLL
jgi:hypothetical protein